MGINFPASPTLNQKYPQPAVAGIPVYTWDGEKWTTVGGSIAAYAPPADAVPLMNAGLGLVGTSTDYAREDHVHPSDASLMAYSGMQINGSMEVSQERGIDNPVAPITASNYVCDGWIAAKAGTMVGNAWAASGAEAFFPAAFKNCIVMNTTTAQPSLAAGDFVYLRNAIEGYRVRRLGWGLANPQPITIGFWSAHTRTGTYSGAVFNANLDRSCVFSYTQTVSDAAEYKTVTIPGCPSGTWNPTEGLGMSVSFAMAAGSTNIAPSTGVWHNTLYIAAAGQVNGVAATTDNFRITGVTVLPGTQAPTAAQSPNIMRPYGEELEICRRYYQKVVTNFRTYSPAVGATFEYGIELSPNMRAAPTLAFIGGSNSGLNSTNLYNASVYGFRFNVIAGITGDVYHIDGSVACDARL